MLRIWLVNVTNLVSKCEQWLVFYDVSN